MLESVYEAVLAHELKRRGLNAVRQVPVPIVWDEIQFEEGYRLDLLVEDKVIVEVKSIESVERVAQEAAVDLFAFTQQTPRNSN